MCCDEVHCSEASPASQAALIPENKTRQLNHHVVAGSRATSRIVIPASLAPPSRLTQNCLFSGDAAYVSAKDSSGDDAGQPTITKNTSRTKSAIATSLKSVACGKLGQS